MRRSHAIEEKSRVESRELRDESQSLRTAHEESVREVKDVKVDKAGEQWHAFQGFQVSTAAFLASTPRHARELLTGNSCLRNTAGPMNVRALGARAHAFEPVSPERHLFVCFSVMAVCNCIDADSCCRIYRCQLSVCLSIFYLSIYLQTLYYHESFC